eukprot:TRINITY_DN4041_c0_g1_i2.p1 TRINITY_DN4041_c0_g1~~TRINITY_DN4041_c0_g1_i2.p1  ORF type:complete len:433 (-),score=27.79 TRINITY_DN4041_c0_g1_i2:85-1383(-)
MNIYIFLCLKFILFSGNVDDSNRHKGSIVMFSSLSEYMGESWNWESYPKEPFLVSKGVVGVFVKEFFPSVSPGSDGLTRWDVRCADYDCKIPIFSISEEAYSFLYLSAYNGTNITIIDFEFNQWEEWTTGDAYIATVSVLGTYCGLILLFNVYSVYMLVVNGNFIFNVGTICVVIELIDNLVRLPAIVNDLYGYRADAFSNILFTSCMMLTTVTTVLLIVFWQDITSKISNKIYTFLNPTSLRIAIGLSIGLLVLEVVNNIVFAFVSVYDSKYRVAIYSVFAVILSTYYFYVSYKVVKQLNTLSISNRRKIRATKMIIKIVVCGAFHYVCSISAFFAVIFGSYYPVAWVMCVVTAYVSILTISLIKLLLFTTTKQKTSSSSENNSTKFKDVNSSHSNTLTNPEELVVNKVLVHESQTETENENVSQTISDAG